MPHVIHPPRLHGPQTRSPDQVWALATAGLALIAVVLAFAGAYDPGAVVALVGVLAGGWAMLISRTRGERFEVVAGTVACAVALAACLAYGSGFSFGGIL
ncbi:MAG: hypothetical protein EPN99_16405 [Frankiales bacterium]|nr:MAG: hypothetical protein EPN99_16405 [Frankiales bacterium]